VKGKGRTDGNRPLNLKTAAAAVIAKRNAELRALYVVVPPGNEAKPVSCPICKEAVESEFLADDEDWVRKNATKKDDRVCFRSLHWFLWLLIFFDRYTVRYATQRLSL
jgi:pre-mRNA cleavage complex 2 protein Pcf11